MKETLRKIDIITLCLVIIVVNLAYCYAQLKVFDKDYVNFFGYTIFQVITGSMEDTIKINDIVLVKLTDDFDVGDIVTFRSGHDFVTHRVIRFEGKKVVTQGDANNTEDKPMIKEMVIGKVVHIFSNVQVWINVLKTPEVIFAGVGTVAMIAFLFAGNSHQKKKKEKKISKED